MQHPYKTQRHHTPGRSDQAHCTICANNMQPALPAA